MAKFLQEYYADPANKGKSLILHTKEMRVAPDCQLLGLSLAEANLRQRLGVIILVIRHPDGQLLFNPGPQERIASGDCLFVAGDSDKLKELETLAGIKN